METSTDSETLHGLPVVSMDNSSSRAFQSTGVDSDLLLPIPESKYCYTTPPRASTTTAAAAAATTTTTTTTVAAATTSTATGGAGDGGTGIPKAAKTQLRRQ